MKLRFRNYIIWFVTITLLEITLPKLLPSVFTFSWSDLKSMFIYMIVAIVCIEIIEKFKSINNKK